MSEYIDALLALVASQRGEIERWHDAFNEGEAEIVAYRNRVKQESLRADNAFEAAAKVCDDEYRYRSKRCVEPMPGDDSTVQGHKSVTANILAQRIRVLAAKGTP